MSMIEGRFPDVRRARDERRRCRSSCDSASWQTGARNDCATARGLVHYLRMLLVGRNSASRNTYIKHCTEARSLRANAQQFLSDMSQTEIEPNHIDTW